MTSLTPTGGAGSSSSHSLSPSSVSALVADVDATVPDDLWFIGILFAAMTNLFGTLAKHCFRRAALVRSSHRMYALYGLGLLFVMCEPPGDMIALSFAPMAIVTSCSGLTNVFNLLLAPCTLGEKLTRVRVGSALAVLVGTIGVGCFGPHEHRDRTAHEYILLFSTHRVIFYYVCLVTWLLVAAAIAYMNRFPGARLFGAAFAGTLLGNNIMTKIVVQLVICAADGETHAGCDGENPLHTWEMYIFFLLAVGIAMGGMVANAITLRSAEALDAITIFQGFLLIFGAMSSYFVLNEQVRRLSRHRRLAPPRSASRCLMRRPSPRRPERSRAPCPTRR